MDFKFRKVYKKIVIGFISSLIILLLASRSIYYALTPKVDYVAYSEGSLVENKLIVGNVVRQNIKCYYSNQPLMVIDVVQRTSNEVEKGEILFKADTSPLKEKLDDIEYQINQLKLQYRQYEEIKDNESYEVEVCQKELKDLENEYDTQKELFDGGIITQSELDSYLEVLSNKRLELNYLMTKSDPNNKINESQIYTENINLLIQKRERIQNEILEYSTYCAKESGEIIETHFKKGTLIEANQVFLELSPNDSAYEIVSSIPLSFAKKLKIGDDLSVETADGTLIEAIVKSILRQGGQSQLTLAVRDEDAFEDLYQGQEVSYFIKQDLGDYKMILPQSCIRHENGNDYIYVLKNEKTPLGQVFTANQVKVDILEQTANKVAISSENITREDKIISDASDFLTDHMKVVINLSE